jgi:general secretion pathway protein H
MRDPRTGVSSSGFTLLEILLVLAIATALLAFVAPDLYRSISSTELPKTTQQLASALRYSRSQAISLSRPVSLLINVEARHYRVSTQAETQALSKQIDFNLLTGATLIQSNEEGAIMYYPDGSSSGGQITLQQGERQQKIDVNWLTGEVLISDDA